MDCILNIQSFTVDLLAEHKEMPVFKCRYLSKVCEHDLFVWVTWIWCRSCEWWLILVRISECLFFQKCDFFGFCPNTCMSSVFCIESFRVKRKGIFSWLITGRSFIIERGLIGLFCALLSSALHYTWKWHSELTVTGAVGTVLEVFAGVSPNV